MNRYLRNKIIGAIAITAAALAATAAFAENPAADQRARLAKLWGTDTAVAYEAAAPRKNFAGTGSATRRTTTGVWADNFQGGRVHAPADH